MATARQKDVVDLLIDQHHQIKKLFQRLKMSKGEHKRELFDELVRTLAVHESVEEEVLHPAARIHSSEVVRDRLHEEHEAKQLLAELCTLGVDHPDFDAKLATLADAVVQHATHEENQEFPSLRENLPKARLQRMAVALRAAEQTAPTRPHPRAGESAPAQLLVGTPVGLLDRVRDTVRGWRHSPGST
jgi:hemerythrin superfamily protein